MNKEVDSASQISGAFMTEGQKTTEGRFSWKNEGEEQKKKKRRKKEGK